MSAPARKPRITTGTQIRPTRIAPAPLRSSRIAPAPIRSSRITPAPIRSSRIAPAPTAASARKGRVVSVPVPKAGPSPAKRLNDILTDALTRAKVIKVTPGNRAALQNARKLAASILSVLPEDESTVQNLSYELHCVSLSSLVNELATDVKYNPEDQGDQQAQMLQCIMEEIIKWLPDIWLAMADTNADMELVRSCLMLCSSVADQVANCLGDYFEWTRRLVITDSNQQTVYDGDHLVGDYMAWMWREYLVFSAIRGSRIPPNEAIWGESYDDVLNLIRRTPGESENAIGLAFWDDHWSAEMRTAALRLYSERHRHRINSFFEAPSVHLYTSLVSDYPDIESSLLISIKQNIFGEEPSIPYTDAAKILAKASQTEDVVCLLDRLIEDGISHHNSTILVIMKYLSTISDEEQRAHALQVVRDGLETAKRDALDALVQLFPGLEDAQDWLRSLIDAGGLTCDEDLFDDSYPERESNLSSFAERAAQGGPLTDPDWTPPKKQGVDPDDICHKEQPKRDLVRCIRDWAQILCQWPDEEAAADVWSTVKFDGSELLFSSVEGAEEALMDRIKVADSVQAEKRHRAKPTPVECPASPSSREQLLTWRVTATFDDYYESPSYVYGYVTDGLQALIKTFSCRDHRALSK
ncbi:uncharacterized protein EV420DRAFT_129183 [Desarmillaria tabescens]|uniref:Uncharacterized protein n=1 Tax=Armillaria tabescens TaxID=1929756 RepID=A0AA39NA03_ARMTA|nr:uncharacterized protein EV420DRAFT_129183 [Desarmillaria tabescens]KAK0461791.1 hypothetical protein EV420DRAFT_129183 [Desarmillaria tabescens]